MKDHDVQKLIKLVKRKEILWNLCRVALYIFIIHKSVLRYYFQRTTQNDFKYCGRAL